MKLPRKLDGLLQPRALAPVAVALWPVIYFYPAVLGRMSLVPFDGVHQNVPLRAAAFGLLLGKGELPLWNPYIFSGMPLHAAAQAGVLFPLNWFFLFCGPFLAGNLMTISGYVLAGVGAYLYARRTGASVAGAALTGLIFETCGFMIGQLSHINVVQTSAMLPWVLWALDGYGEGRGRRWGALTAVFVALQAFAGHPQALAYSLLIAGAYTLWSATAAGAGTSNRRRYLSALAPLASGVLLAAVQILPTLELLRNSLRSTTTYEFFTFFSLPPKFLLTFVAPYVLGGGDGHIFAAPYTGPPFYTEFVGYVGAGGLALAFAALVLRRDARTWFWAAAAVACYALALGSNWPLDAYKLIYYVPGLNLFRVPARHLMEVDLALAILAGRGLTALLDAPDRARAARVASASGAGVFALACLAVTAGRPEGLRLADGSAATLASAPELFVPVIVAAVCVAALWLCVLRAGRGPVVLLVFIIALDLALFGHDTGWREGSPRPDHPIWQAPPPLDFVRRLEAGAGAETGGYRILTAHHLFDPGREVIEQTGSDPSNWLFWLHADIYMMYGAENAAGYEGFGLARYSRLAGDMKVWGALSDPEATLRGPGREVDLLNVRYLLARGTHPPESRATNDQLDDQEPAVSGADPREGTGDTARELPAGAERWRYAGTTSGVVIYENMRALPRAWLVPQFVNLSPAATLKTIRSGRLPDGSTWEPTHTALVTTARRKGASQLADTNDAAARQATITRHDANRVEVETDSATPAMLVLAENHYPGWRAYIDGRAVEILRVNYAQRGVIVPAGTHKVVFLYRPWSFFGGLIITVLTGALLCLWSWGYPSPAGSLALKLRRAAAHLSSRKR